jgi:hypothetical protein
MAKNKPSKPPNQSFNRDAPLSDTQHLTISPDEDWALALARKAVICLLTDQPEVTEELVVTASAELGISRSLVYRLVAKFRTAAAGFANRSGVLVLALFTDNHRGAPAKFQRIVAVYDLSTVFPQI